MVELTGLQSTQDLNGRIGIIRDFDPSTTRYTVELIEEDGSTRNVLVRQANIDLLCPPEESQDLPKEAQAQASPAQKPQAKQTTKSEPVRAAPVASSFAVRCASVRFELHCEAEEPSQTAASLASELANAVESCNLFQVQALLRDRADPNGRSRADVPLLMEAASATRGSGHLDLLALLLGWRADPETLLNRERRHKGTRAAFSSEPKQPEREERAVLSTLEPGALAQARRQLKLPGPFAMGGTSPASCLQAQHDGLEVHCEEMEATSAHRLWLYSLDRLRPVLLMRPSGCQPTALMVFLHGLFQSAQMLECMVRDLSSSLPHVLFVMPTAPTRDAWGVGPAWFDHTRSAKKAESLEACRTELLALLSSQGKEWGIPPERVVLAGFSMGGTVAAWTALQVPRCLAGLLLFGTEGLSFTGGWASPKTLCGSGSDRD
eukprot:g28183.t1